MLLIQTEKSARVLFYRQLIALRKRHFFQLKEIIISVFHWENRCYQCTTSSLNIYYQYTITSINISSTPLYASLLPVSDSLLPLHPRFLTGGTRTTRGMAMAIQRHK